MKFLIDTNVLIPLEPTLDRPPDGWTSGAQRFWRAVSGTGQQVFVHPAQRRDIERIRQEALRENRSLQFDKYAELQSPPEADDETLRILGSPPIGSNDWVDHQLLIAVRRNAIDCVVTEDAGIHRGATALGISDRVLTLNEASELINRLVPQGVEPAPLVVRTKAYSLKVEDPIFESLRNDYPGFDQWLKEASLDQRDAWFIPNANGGYASLAIVKISNKRAPDRDLKLCTFKIADEDQGKKYGELMLRQIFEHCYANEISGCYVTVYPKHGALVALFEQFGFRNTGERKGGELVLRKQMAPDGSHADDALRFHVAFGPRHVARSATAHVIPIKPGYDQMLFPQRIQQLTLLPHDQPYGNAILKAYLCNAKMRKIRPGDTLFFYRTTKDQCVRHIGVTEDTLASSDAMAIARFVGLRTVYTLQSIQGLCRSGEVLAIKFRHARTLEPGITFETTKKEALLRGPPQSILGLSNAARDRLWELIDEL